MKKTTCLYLIIFFSLNIFAQTRSRNDQFIITGKIIGQQRGLVSLEYHNKEGKLVKDSNVLQKGNFYFKGYVSEPTLATLRGNVKSISDDDLNAVGLYIEPNDMALELEYNSFKKMKVSGSKTQKEFEELQKEWAQDSATDKIDYQFISTHPNSYVSAFELSLFLSKWSLDSIKTLYNKLTPIVQKSFYGKEVKQKILNIDNSSQGRMAKNFTALDINGNSINLEAFKGRYVLLDFWASWCIPCRKSFPHLKNLFDSYHRNGLEIIGISADLDSVGWKKAIEKDGVSIWHNILDFNKEKEGRIDGSQTIRNKYGVISLPTKILIDRNGMIVGRYGGTGGESDTRLDEKLGELLKQGKQN